MARPSPAVCHRRDWLRWSAAISGATCLGAWDSPRTILGQEPAAAKPLAPLNRFSRVVQEYFVEQVRAAEEKANSVRTTLQTKADAEAYVQSVRAKIQQCFGPWPERTPLKPRVIGKLERDTYHIEKVVFESRPDFLVTANLYLPKGRKFPLPGVVGSCGHSNNGKGEKLYQSFAQGLARMGYVVLIFDPIGQGERLQYTNAQLQPLHGIGTSEHLHAGNQQFLVGEFFGAWRAWDGIRALDYLLSRPEVDPRHVGITGNSGGGTMTTWLAGVDERWTMAAPGCFITTFRRNVENELPADTEQCPPGAIALGLDMADFLAAMAPKPVIVLAKERDYFDVRGATEAYDRLKRLYTLLGKPDNVALQIGPTDHGYSQENREAMYRWFNRATGISDATTEPAIQLEPDEALLCTPHGQVAEWKSRTVFSFTRDKSKQLAAQRAQRTPAELLDAVRTALKLPAMPAVAPEFRILRPLPSRGYPLPHATTYAVETESRVFAVVTRLSKQAHYSRPPRTGPRATLYVAHHSSDVELREVPLLKKLVTDEPEVPLFACDVRGIGESRPDTCGYDQFGRPYGSDFFYAAHALMLDRPYVGQKTFDLLRVLQWLHDYGHTEVHLVAKGWGTVPAKLAAFVHGRIAKTTWLEPLDSFASIAESEEYNWPLSSFIPHVLASFDLPDLEKA